MSRTKLELKVGIFVFLALVLLAVFILKIGNLKSYSSGYPITFIFHNVSGVKPGSPVRFSGVNVGEVVYLRIMEDAVVEGESKNTKIEISTRLKRSLLLPEGSKAFVNTLGLLGEKYIEVIPPARYKAFLKPGDVIIGNDPVVMQDWVDTGKVIAKDLQEIIGKLKNGEGTLGKLINDDGLYEELTGLISDVRQAKQGTIGKMLYDDRLYEELEGLLSDLRRNPWKLFWKAKEK